MCIKKRIGGFMTRKEALESGHKTYQGKTCKHCGTTEKYVVNYSCKKCIVQKSMYKLYDDELMSSYRTPEKTRERVKKWRANNPDKFKSQWERGYDPSRQAKYRANKRNQTPEDANFDMIKEIYAECKRISEETGIPHEVDHIIPIARDGLHHQDNLQILTAEENRSKGARLD